MKITIPAVCALLMISSVLFLLPTTSASGATDVSNVVMNINVTIDNNYASTVVYQEVHNPTNDTKEATFYFTIPERAFLSAFQMTVNGTTYTSRVIGKAAAEEEYNAAKDQNKTASIVQSSSVSLNAFSYKINLKGGQTVSYQLTYQEYVPRYMGKYTYTLPLSKNSFPSEGKFSINIEMRSIVGFASVSVPAYSDASVNKETSGDYSVKYSPASRAFTSDLGVEYTLVEYPSQGKFLNYESGDVGYFMHVFCPAVSDLGGKSMPKDIIFVIDHSGSMEGEKLNQVRDAFKSIVSDLQTSDRFDIIIYDDSVDKWKSEIVDASDSNVESAKSYISGIESDASTDIDLAMSTALGMFPEGGGVPIICFLTDGLPTAGTTDTSTIRANIKEKNTMGAAIFCLAFGSDADFNFLKALALENNGQATQIDVSTSASTQIQGYYDTFSTPLVSNLTFDYGEGTWDVFPTYVSSLYNGSEVVVVGRYNTSLKTITSSVKGMTSDGMKDFGSTFNLKKKSENTFIPQYWGYQKIKDLENQILVEGYSPSLVENITNIAIQFHFVTEYTSMIIVVEQPKEDPYEGPSTDDDYESPGGDDDVADDDAADWDNYSPMVGDDDDDMGVAPQKDDNTAGGIAKSSTVFPLLVFGALAFVVLVIVGVIVLVLVVRSRKPAKAEKKAEPRLKKK